MSTTRIHKHEVSLHGDFSLILPWGSQVISAQEQGYSIQLWEYHRVDEVRKVARFFKVVFTGEEFDCAGLSHIATVKRGALVCHLFENILARQALPATQKEIAQ